MAEELRASGGFHLNEAFIDGSLVCRPLFAAKRRISNATVAENCLESVVNQPSKVYRPSLSGSPDLPIKLTAAPYSTSPVTCSVAVTWANVFPSDHCSTATP